MKNNWQTKKIEEVLDKVTYTNKILSKNFLDAGKFPVISQEEKFISGYWNNSDDLFYVKSPVIVFGDHTKVLKYVDFDFVLGADGIKILKPKHSLDSKYFYYFLKSINLKNLGYARHYRLLKENEINYPDSIVEQKRIVKKLDEFFEKIEKAKENTEKNLQNSRDLFDSYVKTVFNNPKWEIKTVTDICENLDNKRIPVTKRNRLSGNYPYYGASGVVDYVDKYLFDEDLLLVSEDGANLLARTYPIAFSVSGKVWVNNHAHVLRFKHKETQKFLEYYLNSIDLKTYINGMAQPKLNQSSLNSIKVQSPSLIDQEVIVKKLDELSEQTKKLEEIYKKKLNDLEELRKSILNEAFAGRL